MLAAPISEHPRSIVSLSSRNARLTLPGLIAERLAGATTERSGAIFADAQSDDHAISCSRRKFAEHRLRRRRDPDVDFWGDLEISHLRAHPRLGDRDHAGS